MIEGIESQFEQLAATTDVWEKIKILNSLTVALLPSDAQRALELSEQALQLANQNEAKTPSQQRDIATTLHCLSTTNHHLSDHNAALSYAFEALSRFETLNDSEEQAKILTTIANTYLHLSAYPDSLDYFLKALEIWEALTCKEGQANALNHIGYLYTHLEEYNRALAYLEQSLGIAKEIEDTKLQADVLAHSANVYATLGDYESALHCGLESVHLYGENDEPFGKAQALISIGLLYQAQGEYTPALVYFQLALGIFQAMETKHDAALVLAYIGEIYAQQEDQMDLALSHINQALTLAQEIGARQVGYKCHEMLAKLHKRNGNIEQAFFHYEQFHTIKESVFNEKADQRLKHLEITHQVENARKEAEIAHLRNIELEREIAERKRAEEALQASSAKTGALYQLVRTLASYDTLPTMLQAVAKTVASKLPASQAVLHTFDFEKKQVTYFVEGRSGINHPYRPPFDNLMETAIGWAVSKEQPVLSPRGRPDPRESKRVQKQRAASDLGSAIVVPLYYGGKMFGALTAINRSEEPEFGAEDLALLRAMSSQIAIAISNFQRSDEMARLKEFNENIVQGVGEAILIVNNNGFLTFANPAAERLLGHSSDDLLDHHWSKFAAEEEIENIYNIIAQLSTERQERNETILQSKTGQRIPVIISLSPLLEQGKITGALAAFTDITELKTAEEELRQRSIELEMQNTELDAFAHTVAHDLRSPLTTIVGFSDLLATRFDDLSEDRRQYGLQAISESGHKMSEIINELLLMANVRSMESTERYPLDMVTIVTDVQARLSYQIEHSEAEIIIPEAWPLALGYAPWIEEVWANYITNAIKYGGTPPRIELGFTDLAMERKTRRTRKRKNPEEAAQASQLPGHAHIRFWVRDNGEGLTPEAQTRLFTPFERLNKAHIDGHGLGLSIVRRIVEKLGGQVGVESEAGRGSTFFFVLPRADQE